MANLGAPMPAGITTPQDLAVALRYGPQTEQALRRSSYLTDALRQLNAEGSQNIHSGGELAAKLLAAAILNRKAGSSQDAVMAAMRADQGAETATSMAGLRPAPTGEAPTGAAPNLAPVPEAQPPIATPQPQPEAAPAPQQPAPQQGAYSPADRDALIKMGAVEAGGEGPDGIAAAMHVALNRLRSGYGGAKSLYDVIHQPHQFTGIQNGAQADPHAVALASQVADGVLGGQVPDPTNGAQAFLNPELTQKLYGRIPAWAQGNDGHRIGRHVFFGGQGAPQIAQNGAQPPPPPPPPEPGQDVPVETAAAGADPFPASAPGISSPPAAGAAPAGVSPQAPPAGALPPNWPRWKPSPDKLAYVESLLNDPRHHAEGVALADQYRQKMLEPVEAQITMINGAPFYIPKDPTEGVPSMAVPIPQGAMTHIASAESLRVPAAPGTTFSVDPLGNPKQLTAPPAGQMVTSRPGQPYAEHFVPGGTNDPTRPQAPAAGFQYAGPNGTQTIIPGSAADPHAPMNIAAAAERVQGAIRPTIDLARDARTSLGQVQAGYQLQNGAGDVAMLKGLNQLIAHGVVRPADVDQQLKADGIAGSLGELTGFLTSTGKLSPETRAKVAAASQALYASANQQFKSQVLSHRATTDAIYGAGAFDKYVFPSQQAQDLGWVDAPHPPGGPPPPPPQPHLTPGSRDAALAEARRRGLHP